MRGRAGEEGDRNSHIFSHRYLGNYQNESKLQGGRFSWDGNGA